MHLRFISGLAAFCVLLSAPTHAADDAGEIRFHGRIVEGACLVTATPQNLTHPQLNACAAALASTARVSLQNVTPRQTQAQTGHPTPELKIITIEYL